MHKRTNPDYAMGLKVSANTLYGAFGYASSLLHSPRAAATVTVIGRTALALAYTVFTGLGVTVVYGDTDSCFLAAGPKTSTHFDDNIDTHVNVALNIFHRVLKYTPFPSMRMESVLLINKKHYAYTLQDGTVKSKGLSQNRKDRLGICRLATTLIAEKMLLCRDLDNARDEVTRIATRCYSNAIEGTLNMHAVSKEVCHEGNTCYRFTDADGIEQYIPVARSGRGRTCALQQT